MIYLAKTYLKHYHFLHELYVPVDKLVEVQNLDLNKKHEV